MFEQYLQELIAWNKKFNLTAIIDPEGIKTKHFADSLALEQVIKLKDQSIIDIGAGAGFPGLPLKIKYPDLQLTLVEATRKKTEFLKHIVALYKLKGVEIIWGRAEEMIQGRRESFDLAVARAVAKLNILAEYCLPFVKIGGLFVAFKEENVEDEVKEAGAAIKTLGGRLKEIKKVRLAGSDLVRSLVIIEKVSSTPIKFPRHPGIAKKKPL